MRTRVMAGTVLYLVAIVAPVAWLYVMYGASVPVDANNPDDLIALAGTTVVAFVLGLCASKVSHPKPSSPLDGLAEVLQEFRTETGKRDARP